MAKIPLALNINGKEEQLHVEENALLVDVLRRELKLTGTKKGCGEGDCGSCTVIIDGKAVNSCLVLAATVQDKKILTIEGLETREGLHPLQESFVSEGAIQCGFCTPGMVMSAKALLDRNQSPSDAEINKAISGNLCRCTGYVKIRKAIRSAARKMQEQ